MPKNRVFIGVALLILVCLGGEVALLATQNRRLKASIRTLVEMQRPRTLSIGGEVPALELESPRGERSRLDFDLGSPSLLFVFNTSCPSCARTTPHWERLTTSLTGCAEIAAVSGEPGERIAEYGNEKDPGYDLYSVGQEVLAETYSITVVPQTVLVGSGGIVLGVWPGELSPGDVENIERITRRNTDPARPCTAEA